ncbi:MAG: outer membrane beta-barrel protein [Flavobacteriaceae bacterium]
MKKIILTVAAVFAFSFANAQDKKGGSEGFSKGDIYLAGTVQLTNQKQGDAKADGLTIAPGVGYMLTENLAIEGSLAYISSSTDNGGGAVKDSGFGVGAGVNYYFTPADKFSLSLGAGLSYATTKNDQTDVKVNTIGLSVPVGLNYFVSSNFALTAEWAGLSYTSAKADSTGAEALNTIKIGGDMSALTFGLLYKL